MTISQLQRLRGAAEGLGDGLLPRPRGSETPGADKFGDAFQQAIERVDGAQKAADSQIESFVAGEQENLHEVMISMNEAKLSFQLMTEVRNRMLETYQELMRMQV